MTDRETLLAKLNDAASLSDADLFDCAVFFGFVIEVKTLTSAEFGPLDVLRVRSPIFGANRLEAAIAAEIDDAMWDRWERFSGYAERRAKA